MSFPVVSVCYLLQYVALGFFLKLCHDRIANADFNQEVMRVIIEEAIRATRIHPKHTIAKPPPMLSVKDMTGVGEKLNRDYWRCVVSRT